MSSVTSERHRPPAAERDPCRRTRTAASRSGIDSGSTDSGCSPSNPSTTAVTVPWPIPVAPSEPKSSTRTPAVALNSSRSASRPTNLSAARIGPTVCELDGPIPTLKSSKTLITARAAQPVNPRRRLICSAAAMVIAATSSKREGSNRYAGPETLSAAMALPALSRTGTPTALRPISNSSHTLAHSCCEPRPARQPAQRCR